MPKQQRANPKKGKKVLSAEERARRETQMAMAHSPQGQMPGGRPNVSSDSIIKMLTQQRNAANDQMAFWAARAQDLENENAALRNENDALRQALGVANGEDEGNNEGNEEVEPSAEVTKLAPRANRARKASKSGKAG